MTSDAQTEREQRELLGVTIRPTEQPLTVLGLVAWRKLWSMGKGAGASAFMRGWTALAAAGHRVHLVQPCEAGEEGESECGGVRFHKYKGPEVFSDPALALPARLWSRAWRYEYYRMRAPGKALHLANRIAPDIVIAYGIMTAPSARRVAGRLGCPLIGRYFGNTLSLALHNRRRWYGNFMERIGFRVPVNAMILTNDGSPVLDVLRRLEVDFTPIHYLRNGIPEDVFTPGPRPEALARKLALPENAFVLMSVTRLASEKRLDRVMRALAVLRRERPEAVAILLGDGPEKPALERLAAELGVADAVRFPGPVPNVELAPWYRLADVVVSLLDRTNASNPVFEAMACERCVLALDVGTTSEVVRDRETGVLVAPDREAEIPRIFAELARDPERRHALGRKARPFILDLCGTVKTRLEREVGIVEEVARTRGVVRGNLPEPTHTSASISSR